MNTLSIKRGNDYICLDFKYDLLKSSENSNQKLIIPSNYWHININLLINGNRLSQTSYNSLVESISLNLLNIKLWEDLEYKPNLFINNEHSFIIELECQVFSSIKNEFTENSKVDIIKSITIDINYLTDSMTLQLANLVDSLNYLLHSLFLNLEFRFPLLFSFYGRKLLKLNYNWLTRNINEIWDFNLSALQISTSLSESYKENDVPSDIRKDDLLIKALFDLQDKILFEFNSLNIWKECDLSRFKFDACKRYKKKYLGENSKKFKPTASLSIKNMIYDFGLLSLTTIESNLT